MKKTTLLFFTLLSLLYNLTGGIFKVKAGPYNEVCTIQYAEEADYLNWVYCLRSYHARRYGIKYEEPNVAKYGSKWGRWVTFPNKILAIALNVGKWKDPEELFRSKDFIAMYEHPNYYYRHIINYLANPKHKEEYKKIAIYSLENLSYKAYTTFTKHCYQLYQQKQLSEELFKMVLSFEFLQIHPLITATRNEFKLANESFLRKIQLDLGITSDIGLLIEKILSREMLLTWNKKTKKSYSAYRNPLPFADIISESSKELASHINTNMLEHHPRPYKREKPYKTPDFLIIYDHPSYYTDKALAFLHNPDYTDEEHQLAFLAIQQLNSDLYGSLIKEILSRWDEQFRRVFDNILKFPFPVSYIDSGIINSEGKHTRKASPFYKYPFFIANYKNSRLAKILDQCINHPNIPSHQKDIVQKIKNGQLASTNGLNYIEKNSAFYKTHFRLYETVRPPKI